MEQLLVLIILLRLRFLRCVKKVIRFERICHYYSDNVLSKIDLTSFQKEGNLCLQKQKLNFFQCRIQTKRVYLLQIGCNFFNCPFFLLLKNGIHSRIKLVWKRIRRKVFYQRILFCKTKCPLVDEKEKFCQ